MTDFFWLDCSYIVSLGDNRILLVGLRQNSIDGLRLNSFDWVTSEFFVEVVSKVKIVSNLN